MPCSVLCILFVERYAQIRNATSEEILGQTIQPTRVDLPGTRCWPEFSLAALTLDLLIYPCFATRVLA